MKHVERRTVPRMLTGLAVLLCTPMMLVQGASSEKRAAPRVIDDFVDTETTPWEFITDKVMGGSSTGKMDFVSRDNKPSLHMTGSVSSKKKNNFIQVRRPVDRKKKYFNASEYDGLRLKVKGNEQTYAIHLKTSSTLFPWQRYEAQFETDGSWQEVFIPFKDFKPKSVKRTAKTSKLKTLAVVAMTPDMQADICIDEIAFCQKEDVKAPLPSAPAKR